MCTSQYYLICYYSILLESYEETIGSLNEKIILMRGEHEREYRQLKEQVIEASSRLHDTMGMYKTRVHRCVHVSTLGRAVSAFLCTSSVLPDVSIT